LEDSAHVSIEPGPLLLSTEVSSDVPELRPSREKHEYILVDLARNNSKNGINSFRKVFQSRTDFEKDENGDLLADSHSTVNRCTNFFP
jgi:hypothetical protein